MSNTYLCTTCGGSRTRIETPGSIFIEIVLWLVFIVPGLVYSLWRFTSSRRVCADCGSPRLIPGDSPGAVAWRARNAV